MVPFADWFPLTVVGATFTTLGILKLYGFSRGIVGGGGKSSACRLLGFCPTWTRQVNVGMTALFFVIGLGCFGMLVWTVLHIGKA